MTKKINILIVNDDGYFAPGLIAIVRILVANGYDVRVVAPSREQSGVSHSITIFTEVLARQVVIAETLQQVPAYAVDGTPADCVKIAPYLFPKFQPDLVLSGCNKGANVGISVHASGTVAAAREACMNGFTAAALSLNVHHTSPATEDMFEGAATLALDVVKHLLSSSLPKDTFLNESVPGFGKGDVKGFKLTTHGNSGYDDHYIEHEMVGDTRRFTLTGSLRPSDDSELDDMKTMCDGWVSVSLLRIRTSESIHTIANWSLFDQS